MTVTIPQLLTDEPTRPLFRSEYDQLVRAGAFEDERLELIEGRLVPMSPQGERHAYVIQKLTMVLVRAVGDVADVRVQCPMGLSELSEPEPDFAVVGRDVDVLADHPSGALLVVEVAESSLRRDRRLKAALYARAGIGEYWIVDAAASDVIVHRAPQGQAYQDVFRVGPGMQLTLTALPDVSVATSAFLPGER